MTECTITAARPPGAGWPPCPECGEVRVPIGNGPATRTVRVRCQHEEEADRQAEERREGRERAFRRQQGIDAYRRLAGPPEQYLDATLAHVDDRACSRAGKDAAARYLETWRARRAAGEGLIVAGSIGTGKTLVSVAIANTVAALGCAVRFLTVTGLQSRMRDWDAANETMRDLKRADLLVLDDFGQERVTEWASSVLFDLIDTRYQDKLPTILTTNLGAKQLREHYIRSLTRGSDQMPADQAAITVDRILSRLRERNAHVIFEGPDQRTATEHHWLAK